MTIEELRQRQRELLEETRDPDFNKDIRENSTREATLTELKSITEMISDIEWNNSQEKVRYVPGAICPNTTYRLTYLRVVVLDVELACPPSFKFMITDEFTNIDLFSESKENITISSNCPLGETILNKLPGRFRVPTPNGYIEIEVST